MGARGLGHLYRLITKQGIAQEAATTTGVLHRWHPEADRAASPTTSA